MENAKEAEFKAKMTELLSFAKENGITLMAIAGDVTTSNGKIAVCSNSQNKNIMIVALLNAMIANEDFDEMARKAVKIADYFEMDAYVKANIFGKDE